jgi:hypothetical protein
MQPWERRLADLSQTLANCTTSYFAPEPFRRNVNHFLTTSRTVTFLIQKVKAQIPDYDAWYSEHVLDAWSKDAVMKWAKEARNYVEKEGDLEINSKLMVTLFFSYLEETDIKLNVGQTELVSAGITKLVRFAQKSLPTHVERDAAIKIERRWVTVSLPDWELLRALTYVYRRVLDCCVELADHLDIELDTSVVNPIKEMPDQVSFAQYVKLSTGASYRVGSTPNMIDPAFSFPPEIRDAFVGPTLSDRRPPKTFDEVMEYYTRTARATFEYYGNHAPMLFVFDAQWTLLKQMSVYFADQTDKYIFWRLVAEKVRVMRGFGIIWVGEQWLREAEEMPSGGPRRGKIFGEQLALTGLDREGHFKYLTWEIIRSTGDEKPKLELSRKEMEFDGAANYLAPTLRAIGIPDDSPMMPRDARR